MALNGRIRLILQLSLLTLAQALPQLALPNCPTQCGNLKNIPYPFGIGDGCYLPQRKHFGIVCNNSSDPPQAIWAPASEDILVTNISLQDSELQIMQYVTRECYNEQGVKTVDKVPSFRSPFVISNTKNKFIAVGCDTGAFVDGYRGEAKYVAGCPSYCASLTGLNDSSCSGVGCCQTSIPSGLNNQTVRLASFDNHTGGIWDFNPCSYAFIVQEGHFTFSTKFLKELESIDKLPMLLDWAIGNDSTCDAAQKREDFACNANSKCVDPPNQNGYICQCLPGYQGNPYLPQGCQDVDECENHPCDAGSTCQNERGSYSCICNKGYKKNKGYTVDGKNGTRCIKKNNNILLIISLGLGIGVGLLFLLIGAWLGYRLIKKRNDIKRKEMFFKRNGGLLLEQQLSSGEVNVDKIKLFKSNELEKSTDNFNDDRVLGHGGQGTVYKGMLSDGRIVAVKKSKTVDESKLSEFINEVVILSQINHRNVVKIFGCCLETEVPLLVYEFIPNGTLSQYIQEQIEEFPLTWEKRLRIAMEIAGALSYLHSAASFPIFRRDIKSTNILLDEKYRAKVADFGTSRSVGIDQTHLTSTHVQGTFGYLDPEYFQSSQFTEKSDVYSFGVVLVELLTGQKPICAVRRSTEEKEEEEYRSLATYFINSMEENRLFDIVDARVLKEGSETEIRAVANLARRCLNLNGRSRPTMREVIAELEAIQLSKKASSNVGVRNYEGIEFVRTEPIEPCDVVSSSGETWSSVLDGGRSGFIIP